MSDTQIGNKKRQYQKINNILIMDGDHENKTKVNNELICIHITHTNM